MWRDEGSLSVHCVLSGSADCKSLRFAVMKYDVFAVQLVFLFDVLSRLPSPYSVLFSITGFHADRFLQPLCVLISASLRLLWNDVKEELYLTEPT
jgi:hypothetical protein